MATLPVHSWSKSRFDERTSLHVADSFADDELPAADVYVLVHILNDRGLDDKRAVLAKVSEAVDPG
ncbi:methyltransferase [Haloarchaeobius salinus]|uniref:methyltransferase n=1 Tax=Haloarchaeobius salinus TaxID=1198298 RepID=UPI00210F22A9